MLYPCRYLSLVKCTSIWLALASFSVLSITLHAQNRGTNETPQERTDAELEQRTLANPTTAIEVPVVDSLYMVGPGDELMISVFATQYYNYVVTVHSDGSIIVPMIGEVDVRKRTLKEVRHQLLQLLRTQVRSAEIRVSLFKPRQVKVNVSGAIRKPGVVVLPATARVSEALDLTGGQIPDTTSLRNIVVRRIDGTEERADLLRYYRTGDLRANPFVSGGDVIVFPKKDVQYGLHGAVNRHSEIEYVAGETLGEAIELAQGLKASAFLDSVEVVRFLEDNQTTERLFVDLTGYPDTPEKNLRLQPKDLILIRDIPRYRKHELVVIEGEVNYEGSYSIIEGQTKLSELLDWAGGFTRDASLEEATITRKTDQNERDREFERLEKIPAPDMTEDEYEYFKARSRERVGQMVVNFKRLFLGKDSTQDIRLRDGDFIEVPKQKNYIRVIGRVNAPGNVIFEDSWDYQRYISAAGGYGWRAEDGDVRVIKARTGELVDAEDTGDYEIEPGDTIWVPEEPEVKFWEIALEALGVISQLAGIVGIIIAISRINN